LDQFVRIDGGGIDMPSRLSVRETAVDVGLGWEAPKANCAVRIELHIVDVK
jgi:hypothetical protein